jgi:hypothetical protein
MEEPNIIRVDCDVCEKSRDIAGTTITIVHNTTYDTYDYAYFCVMCGSRQVHALDPAWLPQMFSRGCQFQAFEMPYLSFRPGGPNIDHSDIDSFIEALNAHDHLAAYA